MEKFNWAERVTNEDVLFQVGETRSILNVVKGRRWDMTGHVLPHGEELHDTLVKGAVKGRRPPGKPRNSFIT